MNRRLIVDLEALAANYERFRRAAAGPDSEVGAVVKADGYGTGAARAAERLGASGCRSFFVASAEEGASLREAVPDAAIFVFEGPQPDTSDLIRRSELIPVVNDPAGLESWRPYADRPVAVHVDTGMSRLGFPPDVIPDALEDFTVGLLLTHLASADEPSNPANERQIQRFRTVTSRFPGIRTSIGNSAGWLIGHDYQGELGRPGIGLYGGNPFAGRQSPVEPVANLEGRILQLKSVATGEAVGYGGTWIAPEQTTIAVVGIGYADGVPRSLSGRGEMALGGRRCPLLGRVSMDMTVIDVGGVRGVSEGDWVECFGGTISVDEVAELAGTIAYEILTGVGSRVERHYLTAESPSPKSRFSKP
jgi:alanine racemase